MATVEYSKDNVLETLRRNDFIIIDDHDNKIKKLYGVVELSNDNAPLCAVFPDARYQSLNGVYIDNNDGNIHLSIASIGGVLIGYDFENYNRSARGSVKITNVYTA